MAIIKNLNADAVIAVYPFTPQPVIAQAIISGIRIFGRRIKSLAFSTDVAIIKNLNADAVIAVYPFTPQPVIAQAIINVSDAPVFVGVGGGITTGARSVRLAVQAEHQGAFGVVLNAPTSNEVIRVSDAPVFVGVGGGITTGARSVRLAVQAEHQGAFGVVLNAPTSNEVIREINAPVFVGVGGGITTGARSVRLAVQAEHQGAFGVVLNAPTSNEVIREIKNEVDLPVVVTVVSAHTDIRGRLDAGVDILNVSAAAATPEVVAEIRQDFPEVPIIATGGPTDDSIRRTIQAGANAITYTPPSTGELFSQIMDRHRSGS